MGEQSQIRGWAIGWTGKKNMAYITTSELRNAQKVLLGAGKMLGEVGLRLQYTKYEADYKKVWNAVEKLNKRLCADIRKEERR